MVIWITGLPNSGKTELAKKLYFYLKSPAIILDADALRKGLCNNLSFSKEDRQENMRRIAEVAKLLSEEGANVICSLVSPYEEDRLKAREIIGKSSFFLIYLECSKEVRLERDKEKGAYRRTYQTTEYEAPVYYDMIFNTENIGPSLIAEEVMDELDRVGKASYGKD